MARSRLNRRYKRKATRNPAPAYRPNPPLFTEILEYAGPGFGGFAVSRFATRAAATQIAKRAPSWGKHAGAAAAVGTFLAAWFLANRWKWLEKWHTPIVVGSGIAMAQSLIQLYLPALGWMVSDASPELAAADQSLSVAQAPQNMHLLPTNDDPNEFTYNDSFDAGRYGHHQSPPTTGAGTGPGGPAPSDMSDLAIDDVIGAANLGVFAHN
jgi:hypothetical protein